MRLKLLLAASAAALLFASPVVAQQSVTINGTTWTCTNQCNVTVTSTGYSISDCCGGQVHVRFTPSNEVQ